MTIPTFTDLNPQERSRTYHFPAGEVICIPNVSRLAVGKSGTHRLETSTGKKYIIPTGWLALEIDVDSWSC